VLTAACLPDFSQFSPPASLPDKSSLPSEKDKGISSNHSGVPAKEPHLPASSDASAITSQRILLIGDDLFHHNVDAFIMDLPISTLYGALKETLPKNVTLWDESQLRASIAAGSSNVTKVPEQYQRGTMSGPVQALIVSGGRNDFKNIDCAAHPDECQRIQSTALAALSQLFERCKNDGVKTVLYVLYFKAPSPPAFFPLIEAMANELRQKFAGQFHFVVLNPAQTNGNTNPLDPLLPSGEGLKYLAQLIRENLK
jgi:hypothetical protein